MPILSVLSNHSRFGSRIDPGAGAASANVPHFLHLLLSPLALNASTASLICVPRSVQ